MLTHVGLKKSTRAPIGLMLIQWSFRDADLGQLQQKYSARDERPTSVFTDNEIRFCIHFCVSLPVSFQVMGVRR